MKSRSRTRGLRLSGAAGVATALVLVGCAGGDEGRAAARCAGSACTDAAPEPKPKPKLEPPRDAGAPLPREDVEASVPQETPPTKQGVDSGVPPTPEVDAADGGMSSSLGSPESGVLVDEYAICEEAQRRWLDDNVPGWEDREPVDVLREIAKAGLVEDVPNCTGL